MCPEHNQGNSVPEMFNHISGKYDSLNHVLSLGIDKLWRKKMLKLLSNRNCNTIVDLACGTGDVTQSLLTLYPQNLYAIDPAAQMLKIAEEKLKKSDVNIEYIEASAESIPLLDNVADLVTVAFGIRNFSNINDGLKEIYRILSRGGRCVILEFSMPKNIFVKAGYLLYLYLVVPVIGWLFSGNRKAYRYLRDTIISFSKHVNVEQEFEIAGFNFLFQKSLSGGIVRLYLAEKL
jgi:demethylmenaquinone methyltransferase/2-methoxy-6-polyprenyl-1,4-benzoquinol methylase